MPKKVKLPYGVWSFVLGLLESRRVLVTTVHGANRKTYNGGRNLGIWLRKLSPKLERFDTYRQF